MNDYKLQWVHDDEYFRVIMGALDTLQYIFELLPVETTTDAQIWDMSVDPPVRVM